MRRKVFGGLKAQLTAGLVLVGMIPLALSGLTGLAFGRRALTQEVKDTLRAIPDSAGRRVEELLYFRYNDVRLYANLPLIRHKDNNEQKTEFFETVLKFYAPYSWLGATDRTGRIIAASRRDCIGTDAGETEWFQQCKETLSVHIQDVFLLDLCERDPVVGFTAPILGEDGEFMGVVHTEVMTDFVAGGVQGVELGKTGTALLARGDGIVLADEKGADRGLARNISHMQSFKRARSGGSGIVREPDHHGHDSFVSYGLLEGFGSYPGLGWVLLASQSAEETFASSRTLLNISILLGILAVAAMVVMGWRIADRIIEPVHALRDGARTIGGGDLRHRLSVETGDELQDLASEFNRMAEGLEKSRKELLKAERLAVVGKMSVKVAHEICNPLGSISLNAELLEDEIRKDDTSDSNEAVNLLNSMKKEIDRLGGIIEEYLQFARLPVPELGEERINDLLLRLLSSVDRELSKARIRIVKQFADSDPEAMLDGRQLRQAFFNLFRNCIEAMPDGGVLTIATEACNESIEVAVSDTGVGIKAEDLSLIFDPFFSTKEVGSGLGLTVAQQIVEEHGGTITCDSVPGQGSTFRIELPRGDSAAKARLPRRNNG